MCNRIYKINVWAKTRKVSQFVHLGTLRGARRAAVVAVSKNRPELGSSDVLNVQIVDSVSHECVGYRYFTYQGEAVAFLSRWLDSPVDLL